MADEAGRRLERRGEALCDAARTGRLGKVGLGMVGFVWATRGRADEVGPGAKSCDLVRWNAEWTGGLGMIGRSGVRRGKVGQW